MIGCPLVNPSHMLAPPDTTTFQPPGRSDVGYTHALTVNAFDLSSGAFGIEIESFAPSKLNAWPAYPDANVRLPCMSPWCPPTLSSALPSARQWATSPEGGTK